VLLGKPALARVPEMSGMTGDLGLVLRGDRVGRYVIEAPAEGDCV
jgi:hypothetical protein